MILIFGGTGFIGSFVSSLLSSVDEVMLAVRRPVIGHKTVFFRNPAEIPGIIVETNPDVVVNFIGVLRGDYWEAHIEIPRLIALGVEETGSTLLHTSALGADESSKIPYFRTKALGEREVMRVKSHAIVRPSLVLGPGQRLFRDALKFGVFPRLGTKVQPVDLRDLGEVYLKLVEERKKETFNVCGKEVIELGELIKLVFEEAGKNVILAPFPKVLLKLLGRFEPSLLMALRDNTCETNDAVKLLGSLRPLDETIAFIAEGLV